MTVAVPDVVGLTPQKAIQKLCAAGFGVSSITVVKRTGQVDPATSGSAVRVVGTTPGGGAVVKSVTVPTGSGTRTIATKPAWVPVVLRLSEPRNVSVAFKLPAC